MAAAAAVAELCLTPRRDGPTRWGNRKRGLLGARTKIERDIHKEAIKRKLTCGIDKSRVEG